MVVGLPVQGVAFRLWDPSTSKLDMLSLSLGLVDSLDTMASDSVKSDLAWCSLWLSMAFFWALPLDRSFAREIQLGGGCGI